MNCGLPQIKLIIVLGNILPCLVANSPPNYQNILSRYRRLSAQDDSSSQSEWVYPQEIQHSSIPSAIVAPGETLQIQCSVPYGGSQNKPKLLWASNAFWRVPDKVKWANVILQKKGWYRFDQKSLVIWLLFKQCEIAICL